MLSREKQREILLQLRDVYPAHHSFYVHSEGEAREMAANLKYLEDHGLCVSGLQIGADESIMFGASAITVRGLDFLAEDGGHVHVGTTAPAEPPTAKLSDAVILKPTFMGMGFDLQKGWNWLQDKLRGARHS
jgi:hypothetical protein